jgi:alpha-aminoadipate carrier protein LysW
MSTVSTAVQCLQCATDIEIPAATEPGDIVACRGCSQEHEVVELQPTVRLELAPEVEEDWGE